MPGQACNTCNGRDDRGYCRDTFPPEVSYFNSSLPALKFSGFNELSQSFERLFVKKPRSMGTLNPMVIVRRRRRSCGGDIDTAFPRARREVKRVHPQDLVVIFRTFKSALGFDLFALLPGVGSG